MKAFWSLLLGLSLLGGCATIQPTLRKETTVILQPDLVPSRLVQAVVKPYVATDINRLDVIPFIEFEPAKFAPLSSFNGQPTSPADPGLIMASQASPSIDLGKPIKLTGLEPNKRYRIYARAYRSDGTLISTNDSFTLLTVGSDDRPTLGTLPLKLVDVPFAGKAQVTLVHEGGRTYDRVETSLVQVVEGAELPIATQSLPLGLPQGDLKFTNLHAHTTYRLRATVRNGNTTMATAAVDLPIEANDDLLEATLSIKVPYVVSTIAGGGPGQYGFVDGIGNQARFFGSYGAAIAPDGTLFVTDSGNYAVRKVTPGGTVSTFAGGTSGFVDGTGNEAQFYAPFGIVCAPDGTLFVTDLLNHAIRKISPNGQVTTLAGGGPEQAGFVDAAGTNARFNRPAGIALDSQGNLLVADSSNHAIRKVTPEGAVTTFAGGTQGLVNGTGTSARFDTPYGIAIAPDGTLFVADTQNHAIRAITPDGEVSTLAGGTGGFLDGTGSEARFYAPQCLASAPDGSLFVADCGTNTIRKLTPQGVVTTVAGSYALAAFADGVATAARFNNPYGIAVAPDGTVFVTDSHNYVLRKLR